MNGPPSDTSLLTQFSRFLHERLGGDDDEHPPGNASQIDSIISF